MVRQQWLSRDAHVAQRALQRRLAGNSAIWRRKLRNRRHQSPVEFDRS